MLPRAIAWADLDRRGWNRELSFERRSLLHRSDAELFKLFADRNVTSRARKPLKEFRLRTQAHRLIWEMGSHRNSLPAGAPQNSGAPAMRRTRREAFRSMSS